jgi:hypothetical protein
MIKIEKINFCHALLRRQNGQLSTLTYAVTSCLGFVNRSACSVTFLGIGEEGVLAIRIHVSRWLASLRIGYWAA